MNRRQFIRGLALAPIGAAAAVMVPAGASAASASARVMILPKKTYPRLAFDRQAMQFRWCHSWMEEALFHAEGSMLSLYRRRAIKPTWRVNPNAETELARMCERALTTV